MVAEMGKYWFIFYEGKLVLSREAHFFSRDALPELPGKLSLARRRVDSWLGDEVLGFFFSNSNYDHTERSGQSPTLQI